MCFSFGFWFRFQLQSGWMALDGLLSCTFFAWVSLWFHDASTWSLDFALVVPCSKIILLIYQSSGLGLFRQCGIYGFEFIACEPNEPHIACKICSKTSLDSKQQCCRSSAGAEITWIFRPSRFMHIHCLLTSEIWNKRTSNPSKCVSPSVKSVRGNISAPSLLHRVSTADIVPVQTEQMRFWIRYLVYD